MSDFRMILDELRTHPKFGFLTIALDVEEKQASKNKEESLIEYFEHELEAYEVKNGICTQCEKIILEDEDYYTDHGDAIFHKTPECLGWLRKKDMEEILKRS